MTPLRAPALLALALSCCLLAPSATAAERSYRKLTLENGLRVVLASDPEVNESAASMAVGVGANADPEDAQGLAHFLEHMLFLANEKYPELNSYSEFLQAHGGFSNAYTAQDLTNFHFQVGHDALPEALDRFAQFFISPTLDYAYAQREVAAVNSEHQKNTMDDTWRLMQLTRSLLRPDHPANAFSTGNSETLAKVKEETLRAFFQAYYKPSNMTLAVLSRRGLDELEALVRERFAGIPAGEPKPWSCPADQLDEVEALRLIQVEPIKDLRQLRIFVDIPNQHPHALSKVATVVGMAMGDEGKGSLLSHLKKLGLATSLSAGAGGNRFYSSCSVTVGLTPAGVKRWREVAELCFAYFNLLREQPFPRYLWEEAKTLAELDDRYSPKPEGTNAVIALANNALSFGLDVAERVAVTFQEPKLEDYRELVAALEPKNALVFLVAKGVETDRSEPYYGTRYSLREEKGEAYERLREAKLPEGVRLPAPNPFIPKHTRLVPEQPVLLRQDPGVTLYYGQDLEFRRPKVSLHVRILSPAAYGTPRAAALTRLYAAMLQEQLNEFSYPALVAGLSTSLQPSRKGLVLTVSGYSESAFTLLAMVAKALRGPLDPEAFERVRLRALDGAKNFPLGQAYGYLSELARKLVVRVHVTPDELVPAYEAATLEDLDRHRTALFAKTHLQALCYGNLTAADARRAVKIVEEALGSEPLPASAAYEAEVLRLAPGEEVVFQREGHTDQNCLRIDYQVGPSDVRTRMSAELIGRALRNAFYTEMRTKQKLGYIVFSGSYNRKNVQNLVFLIQSGTHDPEDLRARAEACIASLPDLFASLPPAQFEAIRQSLIEDRKKKLKSIAEKAGFFFDAAFEKDGNFGWIEDEIAALRALEQKEVARLVQETVEGKTRLVFLLRAKGSAPFTKPDGVPDVAAFVKAHTYTAEKPGYALPDEGH
ncbi:MAG: hypothetical protein D6731_20060 [Planctomycetota bacterium]|nr:MAG: hypothetical protein D6731_20060 [Planctomycetota bacterium]